MAAIIDPHLAAELRLRAWQLKVRGLRQSEIAAELSKVYPGVTVGQSTVSRWINGQVRRTLAQLDEEVAFTLVASVQNLRRIDAEAEAAWERSKSSRKESTGTQGGKPAPDVVGPDGKKIPGAKAAPTLKVRTIDRDGDVDFLTERRAAIDQLCRLLHIDQRFAPPPPTDHSAAATNLADAITSAEADVAEHYPIEPEPAPDATDPS